MLVKVKRVEQERSSTLIRCLEEVDSLSPKASTSSPLISDTLI